MAPSAKSGQDNSKHKTQRRYKDHIVKLLVRGKLSGQFSQHLFRKLPPRVCVPLKNIVSEEYLRAGHIFLGFTKCGRYILSYTRDCGEDDDFSFYTYHLYWWEFNLHSRLKQVQYVRLFAGEEIYNDLYLTVCGWPYDQSKIVIFGFNSLLMNLMSAENYRDIYITIVSMPPPHPCHECCALPLSTSVRNESGECLEHGYVLNSRYQVVYPFPTFQPAFHLKKDQVILLNTSYSLVACGISLCQGKAGKSSQILYTKRASLSCQASTSSSPSASASSLPQGSPDRQSTQSKLTQSPLSPRQSQAVTRAREFAADLFRRAQGGAAGDGKEAAFKPSEPLVLNDRQEEPDCPKKMQKDKQTCLTEKLTLGHSSTHSSEQMLCPASSSSSPSPPATLSTSQELEHSEPGYVNYSCLHYCPQPGSLEQNTGGNTGYEDDKVQLAFTVTDLKGRSLQLVNEPDDGQSVRVEQLTLDFEYLINEVIRRDAAWASQFCSFSDYDVVILEVCPETNTVIISIGLLLLAFSPSEHCRPNTYHSNLQVSWDLNTGVCCTVGVGDLTEVKGQTSGRVWSSYRKSCVNTLMKWLIPESSSRYINRLTNEGLHKGTSLQVLADSDRCTWIVL
ncbi:DDB1- and CUL4-associated factor 15 [Corythoichthys intestinalis]|uniref:DDB1- and CUL4-associated factor 15 n=1 Tax=Corythoichthys intestinalis TaxID=161448 RepID=UPI0025A61019|nr:DDB1- and CUL4-associated factor 15 [Corythoichthys intestinalis]XP_061792185.1 DDB1- and CUL4-associated factor 15-like [Nerophis lumbriciformis]